METSLFYIPDREIDAFINALTGSAPEEALTAASGLKSMGVHALGRLGQALVEGGPDLRLRAVQIIAEIRDAEAAPYLVAGLADSDESVRQAALGGLLAMPAEGLPVLLQRLAAGKCPPRLAEGARLVLEGLALSGKLPAPALPLLGELRLGSADDRLADLARVALAEAA